MSALSFAPHLNININPKLTPKPKSKPNKTRVSLQTFPPATFSDPFVVQLAESLEDSLPSSSQPLPLQKLRDFSSQTLLSTPWPSRKDEPFRFTDTSFIKSSQIEPVTRISESATSLGISDDPQFTNLVFVDGFIQKSGLNLSNLPDGVYVGSLLDVSDEIVKRVSEFIGEFQSGDLFWSINGMGAPDLGVIYVPAGCKLENPIYLRYLSVEGGNEESKKLPVSNPRVFVLVEEGAEVGIIEEFVGNEGNDCYWANSVLEVVIGKGGKLKHSYVQNQSFGAAHIKWTAVMQETASTYELVEVSTGGKLSRHNLHVQQLGPETVTELSSFHLSVTNQTQDLHSRLVLDHPRGYSRQLHKCIVAHSAGQAVFDGNVKVNRYAQQTDAGQLTRSLLLEPRATVNVKPNLQIIADDVKCSHGAAISDLEESQLFYFQARGIDLETARKALVVSFGAEVIGQFPYPSLRNQVESHVKELLETKHESSS
ncbi:protein ABCI7, chloroplastic-like [Melia azedarach]|uniref:Protein ABCI7, chloroplastic-like n=1 Tax=Melia azedarach TaxID=155640 RepID=A0ACC1YZD2_MELAZ|nr:protein ABCI7, chloroplastic-like [Melia azedarach]